MEKILKEIKAERIAQDEKWGVQNHNVIEWMSILTEEVGEAAQCANDYYFQNGLPFLRSERKEIFDDIQSNRLRNYRKELIQVAAVAVSMIECLDRNGE